MLNVKLQDNKKQPKWNQRSWMKQFLGFSYLHSSLVALVRNLHTGYVSPQYYIAFDDNYETIFNAGMPDELFNELCNLLFGSSHDCYTEDEYIGDRNLIYKPLPLDKVWLLEPEWQDRCDSLE